MTCVISMAQNRTRDQNMRLVVMKDGRRERSDTTIFPTPNPKEAGRVLIGCFRPMPQMDKYLNIRSLEDINLNLDVIYGIFHLCILWNLTN